MIGVDTIPQYRPGYSQKNRSYSRNSSNEGFSAENGAYMAFGRAGGAREKETDGFGRKKDSNRIEWFTKHQSFSSL